MNDIKAKLLDFNRLSSNAYIPTAISKGFIIHFNRLLILSTLNYLRIWFSFQMRNLIFIVKMKSAGLDRHAPSYLDKLGK